MIDHCPECKLILPRKHLGKKYLDRERLSHFGKYNTAYSKLIRRKCKNLACNYEFIVRIDYPTDAKLSAVESVEVFSSALWNAAKKFKPGIAHLGTTASEGSDLMHRDTANVYQQIIRYFDIAARPVPNRVGMYA